MVDPVSEPRELGVAMSACPVCGTQQQQVQLPDGGVSVEDCPKCWPRTAAPVPMPEKASAQPVMAREQGTVSKEN